MARSNYFRAVTVLAVAVATTLAVGLLVLTKPPVAEAQAQDADLRVDMIGPPQLFVGNSDYFSIVVTNSGSESVTVPAGTVLVRNTLTGAKFNSAGNNPPYQPTFGTDHNTVDFTTTADDTIRPRTGRYFTVSANLEAEGAVSNSVQVDPDGAISEGNETNNGPKTLDMTVLKPPTTTPEADLALVTTDRPDPVRVRETLTYTLKVTNNGPDPLPPGAAINDSLPENTKFVSAKIEEDMGDCVFLGTNFQSVMCRVSDGIARGETVRAKIVVVPRLKGTIENRASARSAGYFTSDSNGPPSDTETTSVKRPR